MWFKNSSKLFSFKYVTDCNLYMNKKVEYVLFEEFIQTRI
jgi:hypothetical protein